MPDQATIVLGFDPGGQGRFGWGVCEAKPEALELIASGLADNCLHAATSSREAIREFSGRQEKEPVVMAAGIDAPLYWGPGGPRHTDDVVRNALADALQELGLPTRSASGTVQYVNSLRGAVLAQGLLLGKNLVQEYGAESFRKTEAHPKALMKILQAQDRERDLDWIPPNLDEHQRDATIAAYAAWSMWSRAIGWVDLYQCEPEPIQPFGIPVSYWMPIP